MCKINKWTAQSSGRREPSKGAIHCINATSVTGQGGACSLGSALCLVTYFPILLPQRAHGLESILLR